MFTKLKLKKIDSTTYELKEDFQYGSHIVPKGYRTDLATTPKFIWSIYPPNSKYYTKSSIIHDYLYDFSDFSRLKCDWIFLKAMKDEGFNMVGRWLFFIGVRLFGGRYR